MTAHVLTYRGREHEFGSAIGKLLRPGIRKRIEYAWSPNEKNRVASGDPWYHNREGARGFVWWGRPQWHDMGYFAVSKSTLESVGGQLTRRVSYSCVLPRSSLWPACESMVAEACMPHSSM